jgi:hypothetical protein
MVDLTRQGRNAPLLRAEGGIAADSFDETIPAIGRPIRFCQTCDVVRRSRDMRAGGWAGQDRRDMGAETVNFDTITAPIYAVGSVARRCRKAYWPADRMTRQTCGARILHESLVVLEN